MKKRKTTLLLVLFFFIGLLVLTYPTISDLYNQKSQSKAIVDYESMLENINNEDQEEIFNKAYEYNEKLSSLDDPFSTSNIIHNYNDILNVNGYGMIGHINIKKIKVELPIYHGTSAETLATSVGHLEGSSFPVGKENTHSVLSAHRGLTSSKLFTDLDKLEIGDTFTITILNKIFVYEVDKITVVKPDEINDLRVEEGEDLVTLMTCTPYGINTHRLLVRGKRVDPNTIKKKYITTESFIVDKLIVMTAFAVPILILLFIITMLKPIENNKQVINKYIYPLGMKEEGESENEEF